MVLKSPDGEWPIMYTTYFTVKMDVINELNLTVWFGFSVQKKDGTTENLFNPSVQVQAGKQGEDSKGNVN